jgi:hypothetical protein
MKHILLRFINGYFIIGLSFGFINQLSWIYSIFTTSYHRFDDVFNLVGFFLFIWSLFIHIILEPIVRSIFWLPSILSLLSPEVDTTFVQWLVPGFYDFLISSQSN